MAKVKAVQIDTDPAKKSIKTLREEIKQYKDDLLNLDQGTKEYSETMQKAANAMHELKELNEEMRASAQDVGEVLSNCTKAFKGVVGAIESVAGVMTLFGASNEDAEKAVKTLTSMIAVVQGLSAVDEGIKAFKRLGLTLKSTTVFMALFGKESKLGTLYAKAQAAAETLLSKVMKSLGVSTKGTTLAMKGLKTALISTGIGALVVAVGELIANFDKICNLFKKAKENYDDFTSALNSSNLQVQIGNNLIDMLTTKQSKAYAEKKRYVELLQALGASQEEIHKAQMELIDLEIKGQRELADEYKITLNAQIASSLGLLDNSMDINTAYSNIVTRQNQIYKLQEDLANESLNLSDKDKKDREDVIKKRENEIKVLQAFITTLKQIDAAETGIADAEGRRQVEEAKWDKQQAKDQADELMAQIKINEAKIEGYKYTEKGKAQYDQYYKLLLNYYANDKLQYANTQAAKIQYDNDYAKHRRQQQEEYRKQLADRSNYDAQRLEEIREENERYKEVEKNADRDVEAEKEIHNKKLQEIEIKYAKLISSEDLKILTQRQKDDENFYKNQLLVDQNYYDDKQRQLDDAFRNRKVKENDYYSQLAEIQIEALQEQAEVQKQAYNADMASADDQIKNLNTLEETLKANGADAESIKAVEDKITELNQFKVDKANEYQQFVILNEKEITDITIEESERQKEYLAAALDNIKNAVVDSFSDILDSADVLSSKWGDALGTLFDGVNKLTLAVKDGGGTWSDYADLACAGLSAASQVLDALAEQQDDSTEEGFEKQKNLQVGSAVMSMLSGIVSAMTNSIRDLGVPAGPIVGAALSSMIAGLGAALIAAIKKQKFDSSSSSSSSISSGAMTSITAPVQYTQDVAGASVEDSINNQKVYVTESDITSTQKKVHVAESEASF